MPECPCQTCATLTRIIADFGLDHRVFLRRPEALQAALTLNPMPDAATAWPNHLLVLFLDKPPAPRAPDRYPA